MSWRRLPIRTRIAAAFAGVMTCLLAAVSISVYSSTAAALLDEVDSGLRFRAAAYAGVSWREPSPQPDPPLEEARESFFRIFTAQRRLLDQSSGLPRAPLLTRSEVATLRRPTFLTKTVHGVQDDARLLAVPIGNHRILIVGVTLADRVDALHQLAAVLAVGGPLAVVIASLAGWLVAGLALRPVERMRRQAAAITASGLDHRLDLPRPRDELHRLARTLNQMLDRIETAVRNDREFLDRASHELRTPLTALQAELELAATGPKTAEALSAAVDSASEEAERLIALANDLLALARLRDGRLPLVRVDCDLRELVNAAANAHAARAQLRGVALDVSATAVTAWLDPMRVRQALDNLVDNALRHGVGAAAIAITASCRPPAVTIAVSDDGRGLGTAPTFGLGLRMVAAVAASHRGTFEIRNRPGGGTIAALVLPGARTEDPEAVSPQSCRILDR